MATKRRSQSKADRTNTVYFKKNLWNIITVAAVVLSLGLIANLTFFGSGNSTDQSPQSASVSAAAPGYDARVQLVASKFRCACGGCGELPLDECTCSMPRGAEEEKNFIRRELDKGRTLDQVIQAVDEKYGHRKT